MENDRLKPNWERHKTNHRPAGERACHCDSKNREFGERRLSLNAIMWLPFLSAIRSFTN
jgi:hypothetical protein